MNVNQIASAIVNDLFSGNLVTLSNRAMISLEQLEDEVIEVRSTILKEWYLKNILKKDDILTSINCIEVDCKDQNRCSCMSTLAHAKMAKHFEIPQLMPGLGTDALAFVGSTDRSTSFKVYYNLEAIKYRKAFQKYRKRIDDKPYVYIEKTPNEHGMFDCWIFNAPLIKYVAVIGIFKDPRQLELYSCRCDNQSSDPDKVQDFLEMGAISDEIKNRILNKKIQLYRTAAPPAAPVV